MTQKLALVIGVILFVGFVVTVALSVYFR